MEILKVKGYDCIPQVGEAGFFIDIAVRDPEYPGEYLMGIECDGATYHSSKSARDRDRLKQQVLEGLGWNIKRIWSTDWFRNPLRTIDPIFNELNTLREENRLRHNEDVNKEEIVATVDVNDENFFDYEDLSIDDTSENDQDICMHDWTNLENCIEKQLTNFAKIIEKEFPDTDYRRRLLSPNMIKHFSEEAPADDDEFHSEIPNYLIEVIDTREKNKYLVTVLNIINSCIEDDG